MHPPIPLTVNQTPFTYRNKRKKKHIRLELPHFIPFQSAAIVQVDFGEHVCHHTRKIAREFGAHVLTQGHVGEGGRRHCQLAEPPLGTRAQTASQYIVCRYV